MKNNTNQNKVVHFLFAIFIVLAGCTGSGSSSGSGKSAASGAGTVIELPDSVIGKFTGTAMIGGQTSQFANATISKSGASVTISFSGGKPALTGSLTLANLKFVTTVQNGVYDSIDKDGSLAGVHVAEYKTNLNVDNVNSGGVNFIFTGVKCNVVPESPLCTCELNPGSPMCQ